MKALYALLPLAPFAAVAVVMAGTGGLKAAGLGQDIRPKGIATKSPKRPDKVVLTAAQWKKRLTPEQYAILRDQGTEPAFCGINLGQKGQGTYYCVGCNLALFRAGEKFDSGTGWPSFFGPISNDRIWVKTDRKFGMLRTEVLCARCDGHLGHVFDDSPKKGGYRYCMNGTVLKFVKDEQ